ncbi:hypothetical protein CBM2634_A160035 [Cupriavidus taiwanensis]|uniref:Secreted protein n=1 Tax=Cupriavidus taiwanensis TaxID=164546 RepID=A0A375IX14_9BURK|nr:hypothetical protein CBM2634_A160035 [Cupriavidus taiwanensis]
MAWTRPAFWRRSGQACACAIASGCCPWITRAMAACCCARRTRWKSRVKQGRQWWRKPWRLCWREAGNGKQAGHKRKQEQQNDNRIQGAQAGHQSRQEQASRDGDGRHRGRGHRGHRRH